MYEPAESRYRASKRTVTETRLVSTHAPIVYVWPAANAMSVWGRDGTLPLHMAAAAHDERRVEVRRGVLRLARAALRLRDDIVLAACQRTDRALLDHGRRLEAVRVDAAQERLVEVHVVEACDGIGQVAERRIVECATRVHCWRVAGLVELGGRARWGGGVGFGIALSFCT